MTELPDRLLRDALRAEASASPSPMCVDANALAAWADGRMTAAERAAVETHAAGCARCLGFLAAMTRTEPPAIAPPWWRRSPIAWLLPLAAVTAGLVIVVGLALLEQRSEVQLPTATPAAVAPPQVNGPQAAPAPAQPPVPAVSSPPAVSRRREHAGSATAPSAALAAAQPKREQAAAAPASPPPAAGAPVARDALSPPPAPPVAATTPTPVAPPAVTRDAVERRAQAGASALAAKAAADAPPAPIVIASPDPNSQWRIVGGTVEHTADGGATWQPQSIGIATRVRAGAAPDARVCWLAGVAGVVLRTTDGGTWTRTPFPETADLVAIQAADASHAVVTTADGRRFTTGDGGATWLVDK
jgi:hypothetical protein